MQDGANAGAVNEAAGGDHRNVDLPYKKPGEGYRPETTIRRICIEHAPVAVCFIAWPLRHGCPLRQRLVPRWDS
jgi:hypothetical protein